LNVGVKRQWGFTPNISGHEAILTESAPQCCPTARFPPHANRTAAFANCSWATEELQEDIVLTVAIRDHVGRLVEVRDMGLDNLAEHYLVRRVRLEHTAPSFQRLPFHCVQVMWDVFPVDTGKGKYHSTK
jgi:hypothetical protein